MDKETLSNYGWIVICVLVLAVMIALAGPFGTFVAGAVKSTTAGLFGVNQNALNAAGITIGDQAFANCEHLETEIRNATADYSGDTCCKECGTVLNTGAYVIPEGGIYYVGVTSNKTNDYSGATATYTAGQPFPETVNTGDVYVFEDYEYRYNQRETHPYNSNVCSWSTYEAQNGWGVRVKSYSKTTYTAILKTIANKPITNMYNTFYGCSKLTVAPEIPDTVIILADTFQGCKSLTEAPAIPGSVNTMYETFQGCTSLTVAPDMTNATGVGHMWYTFYNCTSLSDISKVSVSANIKNMTYAFGNCTSLTGTLIINGNPESCQGCFYGVDMTNITLTGSASKDVLNLIGATGNNWTPLS